MLPTNEPTTIIDTKSFDYWRGQVDTMLQSISQKMDAISDRMASHDEGKADIKSYIEMTTFRLNMHDKIIEEQARAIKELAEATQKFLGAVQNIEKDRSADQKESITFKWIIEKFGMPIAIAAIGFMLFQIMPLIFVLVYYLPKLINHTP
jgi:methyl-accepting chemotaxis protein